MREKNMLTMNKLCYIYRYYQIPASLTCSKLCGVQGGAGQDHLEGIRVISFLRGQGNTARYTLALAASTIIVDSTNRLQMEVTRGVEEIVQDGNRMVQDQDSMSVAGPRRYWKRLGW